MQKWKLEIVKELDKRSEELREIRFYDVAREMGYNHHKSKRCERHRDTLLKRASDLQGGKVRKEPEKGLFYREPLYYTGTY